MRALGSGLITLLSILILTGCPAKEAYLRPAKRPESLAGAPDDPRYDKPPVFPADAMKELKAKKAADLDPSQQQMPQPGGGGSGMPSMGSNMGRGGNY